MALSGGTLLTAWRRGEEIFLAKPGETETPIGAGKDVALAAQASKVFAVWTHAGGIESWVSGRTALLSRTGAFPAVTNLPDGGVLAVWEENGGISVRRLD